MSNADPQFLPRQLYHAGKVIFRAGEPGDRAYIIETGAVEIAIGTGDQRKVLGAIRDGGMFGEMALIDDAPRMADAVAVKDTTCLIVAKDKFRAKVDKADPFIRGLLRILVRNVRAVTREN